MPVIANVDGRPWSDEEWQSTWVTGAFLPLSGERRMVAGLRLWTLAPRGSPAVHLHLLDSRSGEEEDEARRYARQAAAGLHRDVGSALEDATAASWG